MAVHHTARYSFILTHLILPVPILPRQIQYTYIYKNTYNMDKSIGTLDHYTYSIQIHCIDVVFKYILL